MNSGSSMCSALCINWNHSGDGPQKKWPKDFPFDWGKTHFRRVHVVASPLLWRLLSVNAIRYRFECLYSLAA